MRSSSSLEIATLPAVEIYPVPGRMPDMQQPYRRVMRAGGALVKYSGHEQPVSETISLPSPLQERVASFITYYLTDYEPRVDYPPYGNKRYMCHTFAQYLLTGMHAQGGRVINRALELGELGQPVDDDHHFEPGDMGMVADTGSSIPAHSFVSLGGN
ncbi:MAG TPA: hypothetical protein VD735_01905, partial [Candidatus Saccharimonadales bacterium]|nr:hypothetical protein [Candidatus Saccharimonadales bacterium]